MLSVSESVRYWEVDDDDLIINTTQTNDIAFSKLPQIVFIMQAPSIKSWKILDLMLVDPTLTLKKGLLTSN